MVIGIGRIKELSNTIYMILDKPNDYKFVEFEKSTNKNKKYDAILLNKQTNRYKRVPFGAKDYEQYFDATGLGLYSHKNHNDKHRRALYRKRHKGEEKNKFSSGWFSWYYLW